MNASEILTEAARRINNRGGQCCITIGDVAYENNEYGCPEHNRARAAFRLLRQHDDYPQPFSWWPVRERKLRVLALLFAAAIASGCATQPPMARVIDWYPTPDPAYRCAHPQPEDPVPQRVVMMRGGCLWILSEAQVGIITSSKDTSYSDLGAMVRAAMKGK